MATNTWKLQDAKAQFSEVVRRARAGEPQEVTVHGKKAVAIVDLDRFEVRPRPIDDSEETLAGFVERSKKYRARNKSEELQLPPRTKSFPRPLPFVDDDDKAGTDTA